MTTIVNSAVSLGRSLRDARRGKGLTQAQLASESGVTQATVSKVERGASQTSLATLLRILSALQLDLAMHPRASQQPKAPWEND